MRWALPLLAFACTASPTHPSAGVDAGSPAPRAIRRGLQYDGSIAFVRAARSTTGGRELVELSAPIWPDVLQLYDAQNAYPTTVAGEQALYDGASFPFAFLRDDCAPSYPEISEKPDATPTELAVNYDAVAQCAYEKHNAKPYWIPQLLVDADVCSVLGDGYRLPTADDLASLTDADYQIFQDSLTGGTSWAFYYTLTVYLKPLALGDMNPGVATRVTAFPYPPSDYQTAIQWDPAGVVPALRCIRRSIGQYSEMP